MDTVNLGIRVSSRLCLIAFGLCVGCHTPDVKDDVHTDVLLVDDFPVASISAVVTEGSALVQSAPPAWYSEELTMSELWQISMRYEHKFHEPWKYMGTRDGQHYLALYPFMGYRLIYRIDASEFPLDTTFELTSNTGKWQDIFEYSYLGNKYALYIEPLLMDAPEGLLPVDRADAGASLEDLFMQDVQILGLDD
jgi:hypothetical protein